MNALTGTVAAVLGLEDENDVRRVAARARDAFPAPAARLGLTAGAGAVDALSRLLTGRPLDALDADRREALCKVLEGRPAAARLLETLKIPLLQAAATELLPAPPHVPYEGARPDADLDCTPSSAWPSRATADAIVVGSGAGGAMAARTLARAGLSVVVVEEGRRFVAADFRDRPPLERFTRLYRDAGASFALGRPPVLLPEGRAVGGTTVVNSGTCYRTPPHVQRRWSRLGVPMDGFDAYLDEVEATLRVAPQPIDVLGRNGLLALEGARRLGWKAAPLRRNAPGCAGSGQCAAGCPRNAKNGVHLNALPQACAAGARIITHAKVERILVERGRATGIRARRPDGTHLEILASRIVVAAGATQTPPLLRRSGLGGHPGLGRGMAVHPATSMAGRFDEPVTSWSGVMQSAGIEEAHGDGILIEATASPHGMSSFVLPGTGRELRRRLAESGRLAVLGAMIADGPSGRVYGRRRPLPRYDLSARDAARLRRALVAMGRILLAAGARDVLTGLPRHPIARTEEEVSEAVASSPVTDLHLAGFHPTGTARMGGAGTPADPHGRLRGVRGVHLVDASVLPTCPEVNPQLTIMAMALRNADAALADG
ncbi:putative GMC-type oxidoreductase [Actinomadura sp. NBRC 104412]|uniref:GMC family oxidoreductase n=1 Tax=Actinomadura sp. NBRC 104412 TaxID=3032203 RepID=UPI0024A5078B|nr:GMC family oxidoreductase [Actinomadura sp. NBRC 104412]GLZ05044.1 putative GMC-type oxidoreductase [Actinomadura sp. NBRC 104412]